MHLSPVFPLLSIARSKLLLTVSVVILIFLFLGHGYASRQLEHNDQYLGTLVNKQNSQSEIYLLSEARKSYYPLHNDVFDSDPSGEEFSIWLKETFSNPKISITHTVSNHQTNVSEQSDTESKIKAHLISFSYQALHEIFLLDSLISILDFLNYSAYYESCTISKNEKLKEIQLSERHNRLFGHCYMVIFSSNP